MEMLPVLISIVVAAAVLVAVVIAMLVIIAKFRVVPESDEAVVITGSTVKEKSEDGTVTQKPKVVVGGGAYVVPIWNKYKIVSLEVVQIPIAWHGGDGATLPSKDRIPVILEGELSVVVDGKNEDQIILASQKLGIPTRGSRNKDFSMQRAVQQKADKIVAAALRTAVFEFEFVDLNAKKEDFEKRVHELVQQDLAKYGLTLVSVSIPLVSQGHFSDAKGDMFDEQGRQKVAEIVESAQTHKNDTEQQNRIARARRDREAREQELQIQREVAEKEADQQREVAVYQAQQARQQTEATLTEAKAEELATAQQAREVAEAKALEAEKERKAEIAKEEAVAVRTSEADAAKQEANEQASIRKANAEAARAVAEEQAEQEKREAEIAKNKAVEAAKIAKQREIEAAEIEKQKTIEVSEQARQQAVETAEVDRQKAVAVARAEEAAARAEQAGAEAKQKEAEESIVTVKAKAEAVRTRDVEVIKAEEDKQREQIKADQEAYVETKRAEAERDAAMKRAEAVKAQAEGEADAVKAAATGGADAKKTQAAGDAEALTTEANAYAGTVKTRAEADEEAAGKQAHAKMLLAEATLKEGQAVAEAARLRVEAENSISNERLMADVAAEAIKQAPAAIRELMQPIAAVSDVKVLQVNGLGGTGEDGAPAGVPAQIIETALMAAGVLPYLQGGAETLKTNEDVQKLTAALGGAGKAALGAAVQAITDSGEPDSQAPGNGA